MEYLTGRTTKSRLSETLPEPYPILHPLVGKKKKGKLISQHVHGK